VPPGRPDGERCNRARACDDAQPLALSTAADAELPHRTPDATPNEERRHDAAGEGLPTECREGEKRRQPGCVARPVGEARILHPLEQRRHLQEV
jgi:hypothetical protein